MSKRDSLKILVLNALEREGRPLTWVECAKSIWDNEEGEIRAGGTLLYTWQYDMRWAMQVLRDEGRVERVGRGLWGLKL